MDDKAALIENVTGESESLVDYRKRIYEEKVYAWKKKNALHIGFAQET